MKRIIMLVLLFAALKVAGQTTGYLRFDTVKIMKQNGSCELYLINSTKDSLGVLTNVGGGLTRFIKSKVLNDSTIIIGLDTLVIHGAGTSGSSITLNNIGSGHRLVATPGGNIKTLIFGYGVNGDSTTNANSITVVADTTETNHLVTQSDLNDAVASAVGSQNIQQVLNIGDTSNRPIIYKFSEDTTDSRYTKVVIPTNFGVNYGAEGDQGIYSSGIIRYNGVNASGRPNVVYNLLQYNTTNGGGRISTEDAAYRFGFETHFNISGQRLFEIHFPDLILYNGTHIRPNSLYINKETGGTQFQHLATDLVTYTKPNGDALFDFGSNGSYTMTGYGDGSYLHLIHDSATGTQYHLNVKNAEVEHKTFSAPNIFDSKIIVNNTYLNDPVVELNDNRTATASNIGMRINISGTSQSKTPIQVEANTTGGIVEDFQNGTGPNELKVLGNGNALVTINNVSTTDPAGGGYNAAFSQWITGTDYSFIGMNYGTSAGPYNGTQLFYRTVTSAPHVWYVGSAQMMRLNSTGFGIGTADPLFGLHVNRSMGINKDSVTHRTTSGARQMLVLDTTTNRVERMNIPSSGTTYTFNNGLTESAGTAKLGGTLSANTTINTGGFTTTWTGSNDNETSFTVDNTGTTSASAILGSTTGTTSIGVSGTSSAYIGVFGSSTTNTGVQGQSSSGVGVIGVSSSGAGLRGQNNPSSTNAIENILTLLRTSSGGAGANGIGSAIQYELETATNGNSQTAGSLAFKWTDATSATRTSAFEIYGVNSASTARKAAIAGNGQWTWDGYGSGTHTVTPARTPVIDASGNVGERIAPKIYTALLSQSGTSDPTATILGTNEIGTIVWTRNSTGNYTGTLTGAFTSNKTWLIVPKGDGTGSFVNNILSWTSANAVLLTTTDNGGTSTDGFTNMSLEIRVYP